MTTDIEASNLKLNRNQNIARALSGVLADTYILMVKTQTVHWNVMGPLFKSVHDLSEEQYNDLFLAIDAIAERIRALGEFTPRSFAEMQNSARLVEETDPQDAKRMLASLSDDHSVLAEQFRDLAELAGERSDGATEDLANARMAFHEQATWMLNALQAD
ncbi:MAG: DNA starvation/stationary phase protection protein [Rhizobiaceae bacterium]